MKAYEDQLRAKRSTMVQRDSITLIRNFDIDVEFEEYLVSLVDSCFELSSRYRLVWNRCG